MTLSTKTRLFPAIAITALLFSCATSEPKTDEGEGAMADTVAASTPNLMVNPSASIPSTNVSDPNPPHGEPGHRCERRV